MFRGRYEHNVDDKGRTSFPAKFREVLAGDDRLVITTQLGDPCLIAYPFPAWAEFEKKVAAGRQFDKAMTSLRRHFISAAEECSIDKAGRVLLPQRLRKHADITDSLLWLGQGNTLEIWSAQKWKEVDEAALTAEGIEELRQKLGDMGL